MAPEEQVKVHDFTRWTERVRDENRRVIDVVEHQAEETVTLMVRPGNTYGGKAKAGDLVKISAEEAQDGSARRALMTVEEAEAIKAEQERRARERAKKKENPLKAMVDAFLGKSEERGEKKRQQREAVEAKRQAAQAKQHDR
jgi:uncharacterized membrane protein YqiK